MTYNYFCTYCGRELSQETVLFEMQPVLTSTVENQFHILSFRMTEAELKSLIASGVPGDMGFTQCRMTFQEFLGYLSNERNLNDPQIQTLTLEDIEEYTKIQTVETGAFTASSGSSLSGLFAGEEEEKKEEKPAAQEEKPASPAILSLERSSSKNEDIQFTKDALREDLDAVRVLFASGEDYRFKIRVNTLMDNQDQEVLVGYTVRTGMPEKSTTVNKRICPYCGEEVFEYAGTAEHRTVAFIGDQKAGKTSTILALAHYAKNAATGAVSGDEIWFGSEKIPSISTIELLSPSPQLQKDLGLYSQGIAPQKTASLRIYDAYSATFRIKNKVQEKHYLLTLTDLPGELCDSNTHKIDTDKILNVFQVALACDAFVLCFDSTTAVGGNAVAMVDNVCSWANEFQKLREQWILDTGRDKNLAHAKSLLRPKASGLFAPVMLIFNKCPDLEKPEKALGQMPADAFNGITQTYMFDDERRTIDTDEIYSRLGETFKEYEGLESAYHARLRVSPFGYPAPNELDIKERPEKKEECRLPKPRHVAELMAWILEATGCVAGDAKYYPDPTIEELVCEFPDNLVTKTQYRSLCPSGEGKNGDIKEALLRCHLFENPSEDDIRILEGFSRATDRLRERFITFASPLTSWISKKFAKD